MMPISWPVSVVLAIMLSIVHLAYRISTNITDAPPLFVQQVSSGRHNSQEVTRNRLCPPSIAGNRRSHLFGDGQRVRIVLPDHVRCSAHSNCGRDEDWHRATSEVGMREGATGTAFAVRDSSLYCRRGMFMEKPSVTTIGSLMRILSSILPLGEAQHNVEDGRRVPESRWPTNPVP